MKSLVIVKTDGSFVALPCAGVQQVGPPLHPPAHPHRREALQVPLLSLQRLQEGHDHQVGQGGGWNESFPSVILEN